MKMDFINEFSFKTIIDCFQLFSDFIRRCRLLYHLTQIYDSVCAVEFNSNYYFDSVVALPMISRPI